MQPVAELDRAAAEIAKQNYDYRINVYSQDELGRLAETFQSMCESIRAAREELIRRERIETIGQLSTSIVHDLRNPLAAIYAGAEMLVDGDLPEEQTRRLAKNIYRASRGIQDMLQQLLDVVRGKSSASEMCNLREVIGAAWDSVASVAENHKIELVRKFQTAWNAPWNGPEWSACFRTCLKTPSKPCVPADESRSARRRTVKVFWCVWKTADPESASAARPAVSAVCDCRKKERAGFGTRTFAPDAVGSWRGFVAGREWSWREGSV